MKSKIILSNVMGLFAGLTAYFIITLFEMEFAFLTSVLFGSLFSTAVFIIFLVNEKIMSKRSKEFEKHISAPVFYKTTGNFDLGNGKTKLCNIYFCDTGILTVCFDKKPYTLDAISPDDIDSYQFDNIHLNIFTKDGRAFFITLSDSMKVIDALKNKGWIE